MVAPHPSAPGDGAVNRPPAHLAGALGATLAAGILAITLVMTLSADADDIRDRLVPDGASGRLFTVDLDPAQDTDRDARALRLITRSPATLIQHDELRLTVATFDTNPRLAQARLLVSGSDCSYDAPSTARLRNNQSLSLTRGSGCTDVSGATGELLLVVRLAAEGRVAVWSLLPRSPLASDDAIFLGRDAPPAAEARPLLHVRGVEHLPETGLRRIDLLAHMWQLGRPSGWLWIAVLAASGCFGLGAWALISFWGRGSSVRASLSAAAAGFGIAFGLSSAYAVIVPPFQAADEPNHFVAFGAAVGRQGLDTESTDWARIAHFERLQFRPSERFRPAHVNEAGATWDDGTVPDSTIRGQGLEWIWRALSPRTDTIPAPRLLLALRLVNVTFFAACVGLLFFAMDRWSGVAHSPLLVLPLLFVPALPFFGMHVSNHATLLGLYLFAGVGVLLLVLDSRFAHFAGAFIGIGWSMGLLISRAAAPLAAFVAVLLAGRLILGDPGRRRWTAFAFWLGVGIPATGALALGNQAYLEALLAGALGPATDAGRALRTLTWAALPAALVLALMELAISGAVRRVRWRPSSRLVRACAHAGALFVFLLCAAALVVPYPTLAALAPQQPPDPWQYLADVMAAGLTLFRFGPPDRLTSYTFWGGFGWLEFGPPQALVSVVAGATGLALVGLFLWIARSGSLRGAIWVAAGLWGYVTALAAYAWVVATATPADFHGRYVLGLYVWLLLICWSALPRAAALSPRLRLWYWLPLACAAAIAIIHAVSLVTIVHRYFG